MPQFDRTIFSIAPEIVACDLENGLALLNPLTGIYYSLDEVGGFIWQKLAFRITLGELSAAVADTFDCGLETAARDLEILVGELRGAGLIHLHTGTDVSQ